MAELDLQSWSNLAQILGALVVVVTVALGYIQLRAMRQDTKLGAVTKAFELLINEETSAARRHIRQTELPAPGAVDPKDFLQMYRVWVSFDNLGIMVAHGLLDEDIALAMFHESIVHCWERLAPHIDEERKSRDGHYQVFFEDLYRRSLDHQALILRPRSWWKRGKAPVALRRADGQRR